MYAIVEIGGKQYRVKQNDIIEVEKQDVDKAKKIILKSVLLVAKDDGELKIGNPIVKDASVVAEHLGVFRGKKLVIYKYRRRKASSHTKKGHRQNLSRLLIKEIKA